MDYLFSYVDSYEDPSPDDLVSFSVVCKAQSGASIEEFQTRLNVDTFQQFLPAAGIWNQIRDQLNASGIEVFGSADTIVPARGSVALFQEIFHAKLRKRIRRITRATSESKQSSIVLAPDSPRPTPPSTMPALYAAIAQPPLYLKPELPAQTPGFNLHLPGDIAQLTSASATHRGPPAGERATGRGVAVAVIDTGFARHPFYEANRYRVQRFASPDTTRPHVDEEPHGTSILANLFACAPDVDGYAIKAGDNSALALAYSMTLVPQPKVISLSWVYDLPVEHVLPLDLIPLRLVILGIVLAGVPVVAAAGNGETSFPAMMPEVIAVGGVAVDETDRLSHWPLASSFVSMIYPDRQVPDLSGIASEMLLPIPPTAAHGPYEWSAGPGGTSSATPQVAGICALLLQKDSTLTPQGVRRALIRNTRAGSGGSTTGAGLVDARASWNGV
jgi:serine protease AprX